MHCLHGKHTAGDRRPMTIAQFTVFALPEKLLFSTLRLRMINIALCEQRNFGENDTQRKVGTLGNTFLIKKS